jgi:hypothetical protein
MNGQTQASAPRPAVWFPHWAEALARVRLPALVRQQYRTALLQYLRFCKQTRQRATVDSARQFMKDIEQQRQLGVSQLATWKGALNWFFSEAGRQNDAGVSSVGHPRPGGRDIPTAATEAPVMTDVPTLGAADLGKTEWEQQLIRELRGRHYRWRTEQTYRGWAWRFVQWLDDGGKRLDSATEADVREFLSRLATLHRASASAQKQALNALVFLLREALGRSLEDFGDYTRARKLTRVPVVLSREECQRLFAALEGATRLMAELMYGSGLRLTELLRLRVHPVR